MVLPMKPAPPVTRQHVPTNSFMISPFPPVSNHTSRYASNNGVLGNIMCDHRTGTNDRISANMYTRKYARLHPDVSAEAHHNTVDHQICGDYRLLTGIPVWAEPRTFAPGPQPT